MQVSQRAGCENGAQRRPCVRKINDVVADYGQAVDACQLGKVSAALMGRLVVGMREADIMHARDEMTRMLAGERVSPSGEWSPFGIFIHAQPFRSRHGSIMLPFNALARAFEQLQARDKEAAGDSV